MNRSYAYAEIQSKWEIFEFKIEQTQTNATNFINCSKNKLTHTNIQPFRGMAGDEKNKFRSGKISWENWIHMDVACTHTHITRSLLLSFILFIHVCARMFISQMYMYVRWGIALDSIQKYHRPWPVFSYSPLFSNLTTLPLVIVFVFLIFPWMLCIHVCTRQLIVLPIELHRVDSCVV